MNSLQHKKLSCGNSDCTVEEWTEEHSAAWAEPWTSRAPNQHQGCGARRALSIDYPLVATDIPYPVFPTTLKALCWHHLGSSGSLSLQLPCWNERPTTVASCMVMMTAKQLPDHSEKKKGGGATGYLRTLVLMLRVWKVLGCLFEEDISALQHGTVFRSYSWPTMSGGVGGTPRLCCSYRGYQVIMHAFIYLFNTSLRGVHIIIYILLYLLC